MLASVVLSPIFGAVVAIAYLHAGADVLSALIAWFLSSNLFILIIAILRSMLQSFITPVPRAALNRLPKVATGYVSWNNQTR